MESSGTAGRKEEELIFLRQIKLEDFSDKEKVFLEDLVGNSQVKSALNQLSTFSSVKDKIDFCNQN